MRFPEFTGEWEESTLESFIDIISGIPIQSEDILEEELGIRILRGINITEGVIRHNKEIDRYYAKPITDKIQKFVLEEKDLVLGMDGSKVGKNVALISKPDVGSILIQRVARIKALKNADIDFIFQKIYSNKFQRYVDVVNTSSGIPHISLQQIKDFETCFPVTLSEQTKIASFLSLIDKRIATQNKIIEDLKLLKSTISEKLFNRVLRFNKQGKDAYPNWELRKLRNFLSIPDKIPIDQIDKNKLLTVKLHLKGVMKNDNTESLSISGTTYYLRKKGQFIFGKQNLFNGAFGIIPDEYDDFLSSNDVPSLNINNDKINPLYLLYYMGRRNYYIPLESIAIGSGSKRIHETTLLNLEIAIPTLEEQTSIVSTIYSIEKKFNLEVSVLQYLNMQKKYLLSNLFV